MAGYIELYNLGKTYQTPRGPSVIVRDFNLNMHEREVVSLIGHSGCGKSTVLNMVAGLIEPSQGSVIVARREIEGPGPDRGVVFQSPSLLPWMTAYENVRLGVDGVFPHAREDQRNVIVRHHLASVGLEDALFQRACDLSQGMQQRVGIARALALSPKMLLLDEPFGMLDSLTRMELEETLLSLLDVTPCPTLIVTHDVDEALFMSDRVVMMTTGPAATIGRIVDIPFPRPRRRREVLEHPEYYTIREELITFLESEHLHQPEPKNQGPGAPSPEYSMTTSPPTKQKAASSSAKSLLNILPSEPVDASPLVHVLLAEQSELTAVERFSQRHESLDSSLHEPLYRELIPLTAPGPGEQYAFTVDLDACSGCKSCVTACHEANGLEEDETWRDVGLLVGGYDDFTFLQHVTTACHHCVDPACLSGCPVNAYDKDQLTGIVRHLDDQCIGCQYCIWTCPYEVPRYSKSKGIVRKCDMCRQRLAANDAPACVQSCPNQAIRIEIVRAEAVQARATAGEFLERSPDPRITQPTTQYVSKNSSIYSRTSADERTTKPDHAHWPLVVMLVMTQSAIGMFFADYAARWFFPTLAIESLRFSSAAIATTVFVVGMHLVMLHLGRPQFAFRAFLGWRTSWLSREVIAFGGFVAASGGYVASLLGSDTPNGVRSAIELATLSVGLVAACCSAMIYIATKRVNWGPLPTSLRFSGTLMGLGLCMWAALATTFGVSIAPALLASGGAILFGKLVLESLWYVLGEKARREERRRGWNVLLGPLIHTQRWRVMSTTAGFVLLVALTAQVPWGNDAATTSLLAVGLTLVWTGEILERSLYFRAVGYRGMPGVLS